MTCMSSREIPPMSITKNGRDQFLTCILVRPLPRHLARQVFRIWTQKFVLSALARLRFIWELFTWNDTIGMKPSVTSRRRSTPVRQTSSMPVGMAMRKAVLVFAFVAMHGSLRFAAATCSPSKTGHPFRYYHRSRTHLSPNKDCPDSRRIQPPSAGKIVAFPEVGRLHHRYQRRAPEPRRRSIGRSLSAEWSRRHACPDRAPG